MNRNPLNNDTVYNNIKLYNAKDFLSCYGGGPRAGGGDGALSDSLLEGTEGVPRNGGRK